MLIVGIKYDVPRILSMISPEFLPEFLKTFDSLRNIWTERIKPINLGVQDKGIFVEEKILIKKQIFEGGWLF